MRSQIQGTLAPQKEKKNSIVDPSGGLWRCHVTAPLTEEQAWTGVPAWSNGMLHDGIGEQGASSYISSCSMILSVSRPVQRAYPLLCSPLLHLMTVVYLQELTGRRGDCYHRPPDALQGEKCVGTDEEARGHWTTYMQVEARDCLPGQVLSSCKSENFTAGLVKWLEGIPVGLASSSSTPVLQDK